MYSDKNNKKIAYVVPLQLHIVQLQRLSEQNKRTTSTVEE